MKQVIEISAGEETSNAQFFLQRLHEDHSFRNSLRGLASQASFKKFLHNSGFSFDEYELAKAFVEHMDELNVSSDNNTCSLYEKGLLELL